MQVIDVNQINLRSMMIYDHTKQAVSNNNFTVF